MTRCKTKGCPFDEDAHFNWCGEAPGNHAQVVTHQHWPKKGMGGNNPKSKIVALLCAFCHDRIDNGDWGNAVVTTIEDGKKIEIYRAWNLLGETLIEQVIGISEPDRAAEEAVVGEEPAVKASPSSSAPSGSGSPAVEQQQNNPQVSTDGSSTAEPSVPDEGGNDGLGVGRSRPLDNRLDMAGEGVGGHNQHGGDDSGGSRRVSRPSLAPYNAWAEQIIRVAKKGHNWQFELGDLANEGESRFGEEAWQTLSELGIQPETLSNQMRVAAAIPPSLRRGELKWSHHQVIYRQDKETVEAWLDRCVEEQWNIREFKDALREAGLLPPRKAVKRWTLEELKSAAGAIYEGDQKSLDVCLEFLDHLELMEEL